MTTRLIQVTNDNSLINYEPDNAWRSIPSTSEMFQVGNMGVPISPSLVLTQNGQISFSFDGVEVIVMVTYLPPPTTTESGQSPAANCKVDDNTISVNIPQSAQNNWAICDSGSLSDGVHTLTVDIPNSEAGSSIYFDYILYAPSPNSQPDILTGASIRIEATDPSISYLGGFAVKTDTGSARLANGQGQGMTIPFIGEQLTWYGAYSTLLPSNPSSAEYSIDGGAPNQFALSGPNQDGSLSTLLNQVLFQTEVLSQGPHKITATCVGDGQTGLGLSFVVVQNISSIAPTQSVPDITEVSSTTSSQTTLPAFSQTTSLHTQTTSLHSQTTSLNSQSSTFLSQHTGMSPQPSSTTSPSTPVPSKPTPSSQSTLAKSSSKSTVLIGIIVGLGGCLSVIIVVFLFRRRRHKLFALKPEKKLLKGTFKISPYLLQTQADTPSDSSGIRGQSRSSLLLLGNNTSAKLPPADRIETQINSSINRSDNAISATMFDVPSSPAAIEEEEQMAENPRTVSQTERINHILDDAANLGSLERIGQSSPLTPTQEPISVGAVVDMTERITSLPLSLNATPVDERHADSGIRLHRQLLYDETDSEISWRSKDRLPPEYTRD